ncbi:hypothetical protein [Geotoga petraea]|uniref:Uncharacterized protein n=1 Tax=Geotoga petraea TaxID=28234 RepID=A0A1G6PHF2_9BACT|nr:hypothetical protein [Geotoga petraea]SDC79682.1 hypothetical protein SAMN04488588_1814 [Geotoga petraea]
MDEIKKLLTRNEYIGEGIKFKTLFILDIKNKKDNIGVRALSRETGYSSSFISKLVNNLLKEGYLDTNFNINNKGEKYYKKLKLEFKEILNKINYLSSEIIAKEKVNIYSVTSPFSLYLSENTNNLYKIILKTHTYNFIQNIEKNSFSIIGIIPYMNLKSLGLNIEIIKEIEGGNHIVVGKEKTKKLIILGENTVTDSIYKNSNIIEKNFFKKYNDILYIDNINDLEKKLQIDSSYNVFLWEPISDYIIKKYDLKKIKIFKNANVFTQVFIRNKDIFLEKIIEEKIIFDIKNKYEEYLKNDKKINVHKLEGKLYDRY